MVKRTSSEIKADIIERLGFFPPFFEPALSNPGILENLWRQTLSAYLDSPLPSLFKEKLAALVSRQCAVPYCLICHTATLGPLGMEASEVFHLLDRPTPDASAVQQAVDNIASQVKQPLAVWPAPGSDIEEAILALAITIFQNPEENLPYHTALRQLLAIPLYDALVVFLAYNKMCLTWAEAHPELSYESDQRVKDNLGPLLSSEPRLGQFLKEYAARFQKNLKWRQQEKTLHKTQNLFRLLVEGVMDYAIILIDLNGIITEWNVGAERLLGYPPGEVVGERFELFFTPEDQAAGVPQKELATARATGHARDERFHLRKDGMRIWVKGFMTAIKSEDGVLQAYAKIIQDVTERKKIEQELARWNEELEQRVEKRTQELAHSQTALHQAQKLEAIGQLAGGVAHDFNNLITGILGMSEELKGSLESGDPRRDDVEEIIKAANRAFGVTRQLLAFGRRQVIQPRILEVKVIVSELHKLMQRVLGEDIEIRLNLHETHQIKMDQGQLEQILLNLAINARDAMPQGGKLTIQTADVELHDGDARREFQAPEGSYVMLEVADTGHGMTPDVLTHIFEPFYTTKEKDRGTGLGLATVYGIIKQSQGDIHVYSEPNIGTSFKIYFPPVTGEKPALERKSTVTHSAHGQESILVVEDEDIVRRVVVKRLRQQGYHVVEARNGQEAIDILRSDSAPIDLLMTDVVMPGLSGKDLVDQVRMLRPNVPALYMSGYPEDIITTRGILAPDIDFIEKSHMASGLAAKVREVIDRVQRKV